MDSAHLVDLVEGNDLDGLVRMVDSLSRDRDWDGIVELRDRCEHAVHRGKQLWGAAQFAEYRLALDAPGSYAGAVVVEGAGRFALGPLWEVAASTHEWDEVAPHLAGGPARTMVAHERVVRGEDLTAAPGIDPYVLELPLLLQPWEPAYAVAVYRPDKASFPEHPLPAMTDVDLPAAGTRVDEDVATEALYELAKPWAEQSNGHCEAVAVAADAPAAIRALGPRRAAVVELTPSQALAYMAWTGASGGAYGRRRGTPVGRANAWWAVAALAGRGEEWPLEPDEVGATAAALRWYAWDAGEHATGWGFHLAVHDVRHSLAFAVAANDAA